MAEITLNPIPEIETHPKSEENMFEWISFIRGPDGSVYENGIFEFELSFPIEYPFKPPNCKFKTRIYHCNINSQGNVCLDILQVRNVNGLHQSWAVLYRGTTRHVVTLY